MLKVENISKSFGNTKAVKNISFEINKGDVVGLLGPNGAGKTTTMRLIASYYYPTSGEIIISGTNTKKDTLKSQKHIGYLPENNPLYTDMIVIDYLRMTGGLYNISKKTLDKEIIEVSKKIGIYNKLGTVINNLSKGFKQRVGIAAALIHNPSLIILDEPTEGLDPNQRDEIRTLVKDLSKDKAILISTHVLQEVKAMCTRVLIINDGELVVDGDINSLSSDKTLSVTIEGKDIKEKLTKHFVKDVKLKFNKIEENKYKVEITSENETRTEIAKLCADNNWIIDEMQFVDSLETIFKKLK
jgi:ABC-2 type transport system ATP-binding protein